MSNISNIFLCTTEYHLLLSVHITSVLYESSGFENLIVMTTGMRKNICKYDKSTLLNAKMIEVDWSELRTHNCITSLLKNKCDNFFYFISNFPTHRFIVRNLSKKGAKIILVQDGTKPYSLNHFKLRTILSSTYNNILEFIKIRDYSGIFKQSVYSKYIDDNHIDEVWLTHPEAFHQIINKKQSIIKIPEFSQQSISKLSQFFNYIVTIDFVPNDILYLTQPYLSEELKLIESNFLKNILFKYPHNKLYIKFHPSKDMDIDFYYRELPNAFFLENINYPAELIIQNMNKAIIISQNSAALLLNNQTCRFYYIYPIFNNNPSYNFISPNPTDHIQVISKVEEIQFFEL